MSRPVNMECVAEADAARCIRGGRSDLCRVRSGRANACCRPRGHTGTVHVATMYHGQEVSAVWTDAGRFLYHE